MLLMCVEMEASVPVAHVRPDITGTAVRESYHYINYFCWVRKQQMTTSGAECLDMLRMDPTTQAGTLPLVIVQPAHSRKSTRPTWKYHRLDAPCIHGTIRAGTLAAAHWTCARPPFLQPSFQGVHR